MRRPTVNKPCPYSPSCFSCPCSDCRISGMDAVQINQIDLGFLEERKTENDNHKEKV
jgi:hypothetical protein